MTTTRCGFRKGDIVKGLGVFAPWESGEVEGVAPRELINLVSGKKMIFQNEPRVWVRWKGLRGALSMNPEDLRLVARPAGISAD